MAEQIQPGDQSFDAFEDIGVTPSSKKPQPRPESDSSGSQSNQDSGSPTATPAAQAFADNFMSSRRSRRRKKRRAARRAAKAAAAAAAAAASAEDEEVTTVEEKTEEQIAIETIIASADHYIATGEDDGGGFVNAATGLPMGANNEAEAFLIRTGNFKLNNAQFQSILNNVSDEMKLAMMKNTNQDTFEEAVNFTSSGLLSLGTAGDSRNHAYLLAIGSLNADAFVSAVAEANFQNISRGVPTLDEQGNPAGYAAPVEVTFGMQSGQPMMYGSGGWFGGIGSMGLLQNYFVDPEDIQGIVSGNVYEEYSSYYDKFRSKYEFMGDIDFLNLKPFKLEEIDKSVIGTPAVTNFTSPTSGITNTAGMGQGFTEASTTTAGTQFDTAVAAPVNYTANPAVQTFDTSLPALGGAGTNTYPQEDVSGTFNVATQTGNLSAVPGSVTTGTNYTGTNLSNLTSPTQGAQAVGQGVYVNQATGQQIQMTEINGNPIGVIPPGFGKVTTAAQGAYIKGYEPGGLVEAEKAMAAKFLGFNGTDLEKFLEANPAAAAKMGKYRTALRNKMTQKGTVFASTGTFLPSIATAAADIAKASGMGAKDAPVSEGDPYQEQIAAMQRGAIQQTMQPTQSNVSMIMPQAADFTPTGAGQAYAVAPFAQSAVVPSTAQAGMPVLSPAGTMATTAATPLIQTETAKLSPAQGVLSDESQVTAQQQFATSVAGLEAAQGTATMMNNPVQRQITSDPVTGESEIISGAANAEAASKFTEQLQAATATPSKQATVAGQLETLMADFEGGETPAWAAGSMRTAMQMLSARGLGASSLAGQAVIQASMEAALPIAQMDAQAQAQFEMANLSNRQQRQMLMAQQRAAFLNQEFDQAFQARVQNAGRIADIANMNFNAEQQIALENARAANTINLSNLTNRQAMVMAEAAALSQLDTANLSNRQQSAVQNANSFLQMDMANLTNDQQTSLFKAQQNIQAMFTDAAANNAASQFNATSENQTDQFFASLASQVSQYNASQQNAMDQFNVNNVNSLRQFNAEQQQQRDLFNAQNGLVVAQSNAQWRQNIATMNTAALNESNSNFARTINGLTELNMSQIWQRERDIMSFAFQTANNNADRATSIAIQNLQNEATKDQAAATKSAGFAKAAGSIIGAIVTGTPG